MAGRKSLKDELSVLRRFEQLSPKVFAYVNRMLDSKNKKDNLWAMEWLKTGYAKMLPQKIAGDPDNRTPIPLLNVIRNNNSDQENKPDEEKDSGSTRGHVSVEDDIDSDLFDRLIPER